MTNKVEKALIGGLIVVTVGGVIYTMGGSNAPPTVKTEIVQTNEGAVQLDYKQMVLNELQQESRLVIASNKIKLPVTQTERHWYGSKKQDVTFYAIGRYSLDLSKLSDDNVVVNNDSRIITVYLSKPCLDVELLENETQFSKLDNDLFAFGDIKYTFKEVEAMKYSVKCDMLLKMEDMLEQVKVQAGNSVQRLLLSITKDNYNVKVVFID